MQTDHVQNWSYTGLKRESQYISKILHHSDHALSLIWNKTKYEQQKYNLETPK